MKIVATFVLPLALLGSVPATQQSIVFKKTYVASKSTRYSVTMGTPGTSMGGTIETMVLGPWIDGGVVRYRALDMNPSSQALPDLTTKVGRTGAPNGATIRNAQEFFVLLGAAGMTTGMPAKVGQTVTVHWQNDPKDVTFDGYGKLVSLDDSKGTLTVKWDLTMTPSYTKGGEFKTTSVYSTEDFSLVSSQGTFHLGNASMSLKVDRLPASG